MKNLRLAAFAAVCFFLFSTCKKDDPITNGSIDFPGRSVKASFVGQVLDEADLPVVDAEIRVGSAATKTDANGIFILRDQSVNSARAIVEVSSVGYFDAFRTLFVQKNSQNRLVFRLLKKEKGASFSASTGGKVMVAGGAEVDFLPNSISKNGQPFSENVNVAARWLNPEDEKLTSKMPGALRGLRVDGSENGLRTFGMLAVELTDDAGGKLELSGGQKATISMPIPADLLAAAPATIALWHFSKSEGIWIEEGSATKIGSSYVGEVSHFSWWNCDVAFEAVSLKFCLKLPDGTAWANAPVIFESTDFGFGFAFTGADGCAEGLVPKDAAMKMQLFLPAQNGCNQFLLYEKEIGPFSVDSDLGDVEMPPPTTGGNAPTFYEVKGRLTDCAGAPLANGYCSIGYRDFAFSDGDGHFSTTLFYCNSQPWQISAKGFDLENVGESPVFYKNYSQTVDFGEIPICFYADEYLTYQIDGEAPRTLFVGKDSLILGDQIFVNGNYGGNTCSLLGWKHDEKAANGLEINFLMIGCYPFYAPNISITTDMKSFPKNKGEYLEGTFSGTFGPSWDTKTITGKYRAKRIF